MSNLVKQLQRIADRSATLWQSAADTADTEDDAAEWESLGEECDGFYAEAIDCVLAGDLDGALDALDQARSLEAQGGDSSDASEAMALVEGATGDEL